MTRNDQPDPTDAQPEAVDARFASLSTADEDVIVYDTENPDAWIQSPAAVEIREAR